MTEIVPLIVLAGVLVIVLFGVTALLSRFYVKVDQGKALIVNTLKSEPIVTFTGAIVYPVIHRSEVMDISVRSIEIDRRGKDGLICKDNIRADINVNFFIRVNKTQEDVLRVAQSIGVQRSAQKEILESIFVAKFSEALKTVGKHFDFQDLYKERELFKDKIIEIIEKDLNGFVLDDAAIDYLEQTPMSSLDPNNIMDAEGIRKITELTSLQNVMTNELQQKQRMEMGSQNLTADEALFQFDKRRAEADAKKHKEIAVAQSQQQNEAARIASEEAKKTALVQQKNDEEVLVAGQAKERAVAVAEKAKQREIAVETERNEKARMLEATIREREVSLSQISKEKEIETQKKEIADIVRGRVAVDKTVAEEEERIRDVRVLAEANRQKETVRLGAEAKSMEAMVMQVKAAEASEEAAKHRAREKVVTADADLETADKVARAKIRLAEGISAEAAAPGLAHARVKEAEAQALEKTGLVEARVSFEKLSAEAKGTEEKGLAAARVQEAQATAIEKTGTATANATQQKLVAEAAGLAQKAEAMHALDGMGREHEEYRLKLENERVIALETIRVRQEVIVAQSQVLAKAFGNAKMNIVGGDGRFMENFMRAITFGQSIDGVVDQSQTVQTMFKDYLSGDKSLPDDLKEFVAAARGPNQPTQPTKR